MDTTFDVIKAARKALTILALEQPDLAVGGAGTQHHDGKGKTATAHVTLDGHVYYNPDYAKTLSRGQFLFIVAHEIGHLILCHFERFKNAPDQKLANIACDMSLNHALVGAGLTDYPPGALFPLAGMEEFHAERIYEELAKMQRENTLPESLKDLLEGGDPQPGAGCGPLPPEGSHEESDGSGTTGKTIAELCADWAEAKVQAEQIAIGTGKGSIFLTAGKVPDSKVKWKSIIKRGIESAIASHGRDDQTWTRRGRRSGAVGPQFAGWYTNQAKVAISIDSSGSMSDLMLHTAIAETVAIARNCGALVYLNIHDAGLQWSGWLTDRVTAGDIIAHVSGRGGTCCKEAYKDVEKAAKRFGYFVHLTDGGIWGWPSWPVNCVKRVVALIGYDAKVPDGARIIKVDL